MGIAVKPFFFHKFVIIKSYTYPFTEGFNLFSCYRMKFEGRCYRTFLFYFFVILTISFSIS